MFLIILVGVMIYLLGVPAPHDALPVLRRREMTAARRDLLGQAMAHLVLIVYTIIALFPIVLVLMNSIKNKKAIFGAPLAPPTPETFTLVGFQTVLAQGDFTLYFGNSLTVTVVSLA